MDRKGRAEPLGFHCNRDALLQVVRGRIRRNPPSRETLQWHYNRAISTRCSARQNVAKIRRSLDSSTRQHLAARNFQPLADGSQNRSMVVRYPGCAAKDRARFDVGRDQKGRDADPEAIETESRLAWVALGIGRRRNPWRRYVIVASAVLVIRDQQERLRPVFACADRLIDIVNELFAQSYVMRWMLVIGIDRETRFDEAISRDSAVVSVLLKRRKIVEMAVQRRIP